MRNRKLLAAPLGVAALVLGGGAAYADTIVGNATQNNTQGNTNSQIGQQSAGGGTVVGNVNQGGANNTQNTQNQLQQQGAAGGTMVGQGTQLNSQGNVLIQSGSQNGGNGTTVGNVGQGFTNLGQVQSQSSGQTQPFATIVGSPIAASNQYSGVSQGVNQLDGGVLVGNNTQQANNTQSVGQNNFQQLGVGAAAVIVGNPSTSAAQTTSEPQYIGQAGSSGIVVGTTTQGQANFAQNLNQSQSFIF